MENIKALRLKEKILLIELKAIQDQIALYDESLETTANSEQKSARKQSESIPFQTEKGKEKSNPFIPVALEKSKNKVNEELKSSSSPEANGSGKGTSNPLMADSLPKTAKVSLRPSYSQVAQTAENLNSRFYVIFDGEHRGIYEDWSVVKNYVDRADYPFKKYGSLLQAQQEATRYSANCGKKEIPLKFIYPSPNLLEISNLSEGVKKAIKHFRKKIAVARDANIFIKCNSTLPDWYQGNSFPSYHHLEIGIAKTRTVNPSRVMNEDEDYENWLDIRAKGFIQILNNLQKIKAGSFNKVNYCSTNCIITSYSGTPLPLHEKEVLERMEQRIIFNKIEAGPVTKKQLCKKLQRTIEKHQCEYCEASSSEENKASAGKSSYSSDEDTRELDPTHGFVE
ncbi:putative ribosomal protein L9/RNase H1 [Helianthus annuus]|nr:putative ribosomal protein L9/RNase H1 [Helianthus annuus]